MKKKQKLPFVPFPAKTAIQMSKPFAGLGNKVEKMFPFLKTDLEMASIQIKVKDYTSVIVFIFIFYFIIFAALISVVLSKLLISFSKIGTIVIPHSLILGITLGIVVGILFAVQMIAYPKIMIKKRVREIDSNLVFALRAMLVQIKGGVSLFNALSMISNSKRFGELGVELKKAVDKITTGTSEDVALREVASKNPSNYLRKVIWQITNGLKAGADISDVLSESVSTIVREQQIEIQKYGSSLRILSLMYLMLGVIIPALGITFLIVIGSFPKIEMGEIVFWAMLGALLLAEFMFLGIMKSKRPNLMSD
jgi:pilus assembly protein TadC